VTLVPTPGFVPTVAVAIVATGRLERCVAMVGGAAQGGVPCWEPAWSPKFNKWFYTDRHQGRSSLNKPANCNFELPRDFPPHAGGRLPPSRSPLLQDLPPGWESEWPLRCQRSWYLNRATQQNSWEKPGVALLQDTSGAGTIGNHRNPDNGAPVSASTAPMAGMAGGLPENHHLQKSGGGKHVAAAAAEKPLHHEYGGSFLPATGPALGTGERHCHRLQACVDVAEAMGLGYQLDERFHRCFCEECVRARGDHRSYQRGDFPYIVPFGWCKLALRISDEQKTRMATWVPAFHGTKLERILQILQPPDGGQPRLLFPGDLRADGGDHRVGKGHIEKGFNRTNAHAHVKEYFDPATMIFASPSIRYSEHLAYVPEDGERVTTHEHNELRVKVAIDVRFSPGQPGQPSFGIGQQTVGAAQRLCPVLPNTCLEYYTNRQQTHFISAVMLRIVTHGPLHMKAPNTDIVDVAPLPPVGYIEPPRYKSARPSGEEDERWWNCRTQREEEVRRHFDQDQEFAHILPKALRLCMFNAGFSLCLRQIR